MQTFINILTIIAIGEITMGIAVVTRNFQVTLPKDLRTILDIKIGDRVISEVNEEGSIVLKKFNKSPVDEAFGMWKMKKTGIEYVDKIRSDWRRK